MSSNKKKNPTTSFFASVYVPNYTPEQKELVRGQHQIKSMEEIKADVEEEVKKITSLLTGDFLTPGEYHEPRPLSLEEGRAVINDRKRMKKDVERIRGKMEMLENFIDNKLQSGAASNYVFNFKKRPKLRKALKSITGKAKNFVTYEDYKLALDIKKKLELEGADEYFQETVD